jgi:hypothetical protein
MKDSKRNVYIFVSILLLISIGSILFYYLFFRKITENQQGKEIFEALKNNPEYLERENLLRIKDLPVLEYFRQRKIYYAYNTNSKETFQDELERDFPSDKAKILIQIFKVYEEFENGKEKILKNKELDSYSQLNYIYKLKVNLFGEDLSNLLFPKQNSEKVEEFFYYADRYLKKHFKDLPRNKKIHLDKARKEIYGEDFDTLYSLESPLKKLELEIKIHERELSILNPEERKLAIQDLKEKLYQLKKE